MIFNVLVLTLVVFIIAFSEIPPLIKQGLTGEIYTVIGILILGYALSIALILGLPIPNVVDILFALTR